jgi:hypothetical protein
MAYEKRPNKGTLFKFNKTEDSQPSYKGYLLMDRAMIQDLLNTSNGNIEIDISLWKCETRSGTINLNLECSAKGAPKYYAPEVIHEPTAHQSPAPTSADPQAYLAKLKSKIAACTSLKDFEQLNKKIKAPAVWAVFQSVPAIATEASDLLSEKKSKLVLSAEPVDLSAILSELDVHCQRLNLGKAEHCLVRWNKPRERLSTEELHQYLIELRSAKPMQPQDDFF